MVLREIWRLTAGIVSAGLAMALTVPWVDSGSVCMTFDAFDLGDLPALFLSAALRLFGADLVDCHQNAAVLPAELAELSEEAIWELINIPACGIVFPGGALWLLPETWLKLKFDHDLVGLETSSTVQEDWLPSGVDLGVYWVHRNGQLRKTHMYENEPDFFQRGLARYVDASGKYGFVDRRLRIVIPAAFDFAFPFDAPRAEVCNGCQLEPCDYIDCGQTRQLIGGTFGSVDRRGRVRWRPTR